MGNLKKPIVDELNAYFQTVDKSSMKNIKKDANGKEIGKGKKIDAYELSEEVDLPKKYTEDSWCDDVLSHKKWSEKKAMIDELNDYLIKHPRISPKT